MTSMSTACTRTVCADADSVRNAAEKLRACSHIALDCEGNMLGEHRGSLSVISLGAVPPIPGQGPEVFIVDVAVTGVEALQPIFDILRSHTHIKIVFDGRMDWSELYHRHGIQLSHVLDLQLADVESREKRGEDIDAQLARLSSFCNRYDVKCQGTCYRMVHRLNGMDFCAKEHEVAGLADDVKSRYFSHDEWMKRPLPETHLEYAANDIALIIKLYQHFTRQNYIDEPKLLEQSQRYVSLHRNALPPSNSGHPLLPLEILSSPRSYSPSLTCNTCQRSLSVDCFSQSARRSGGKRNCWVCRALSVRTAAIAKRNDWDDDDYDFDSE